ncbi:hypothetical protein ACJMK2_020540 [Sinanodonta woodiana]|uniref:Uncharacterized protein n=1 Tax=Sinanodonta woodiana TaxID=1069815 RepID=A0ABD3TZH3_SINWO
MEKLNTYHIHSSTLMHSMREEVLCSSQGRVLLPSMRKELHHVHHFQCSKSCSSRYEEQYCSFMSDKDKLGSSISLTSLLSVWSLIKSQFIKGLPSHAL